MCLTLPLPRRFIARKDPFAALVRSTSRQPSLGALQIDTLWDHYEKITISFMSGSGTPQQRTKTKTLFQEIFRFTNLSPSWVSDGDGDVRITFNDGIPSQSRLGTQCRKVPEDEFTINLKSISPDKFRLSSFERQTINHECMHLLAFVHEHQAPERSKHFSFDRSKVHEAYGRDGISAEQIEFNIMDLHPPEALENYSPFDLDSVTLYQFPGYIMQNGGATNANKNLSDTDKAVLVLNYARLDPGPLVSEWTVAHAADVIGIKGEWREKIVAATHPQDIRRLYSDWSKSPQRDQQGEA